MIDQDTIRICNLDLPPSRSTDGEASPVEKLNGGKADLCYYNTISLENVFNHYRGEYVCIVLIKSRCSFYRCKIWKNLYSEPALLQHIPTIVAQSIPLCGVSRTGGRPGQRGRRMHLAARAVKRYIVTL